MKTQSVCVLLIASLTAAALVAPTSAQLDPLDDLLDEIPQEIDIGLGDAYYESFDVDDGDWDKSDVPDPEIERPDPDNPQWQWGEPTSGPGEAHTGDHVWATKLDGPYESTCAALASAPIDLTDAESAQASIQHWMESDESIISLRDAGVVFITTDGGTTFDYVTPTEGYDNDFSFNLEGCFDNISNDNLAYGGGPDFDYREATIDLDEYLGEPEVQVVFSFGSRNSAEDHAGWYLDRFAVTIDGVTEVEDFQDGDGGFEIMTTHRPDSLPQLGWEWGHPEAPDVPSDRNMWGTNMEGDFGHNECAWIESPPIDLGALEFTLATEATLQWDQFFRASFLTAGGVVQIGVDGEYTTIEPDEGYNAEPRPEELEDCLGEEIWELGAYGSFPSPPGSAPYTQTADISDFIGQEITLRYLFASAATGSTSDGWYVDEVIIELRLQQDLPLVSGAHHPLWSADGDWDYGIPMEEGPVNELVYGTNTRGDYSEGPACSILETIIDVPAGDLRWDQWVRSSSISAGGTVQVVDDDGAHVITPNEGYTTSPFSLDTDDCTLHESQDTGVMNGFQQSTGADMVTFNADLSAWAGERVTLRFAWGVEDTTFTNLGWYVNNVVMDGIPLLPTTLGIPLPDDDPEDIIEDAVAEAEARVGQVQSLPEQYPGWIAGGEHISWAYDEATTGPEGQRVTATNPHGMHTESSDEYECSYVQSLPVPTVLMEDTLLSLDHYVEMSVSSFLGARTAGMILVSEDLGMSWEPVSTEANTHEVGYTRIYDCFENLGVPAVDGNNRVLVDELGVISGEEMQGLETLEVDLSAYRDADFLMVRLIFGTGTSIYAQGGWYFNNVQLGGVHLMD